MARQPSTRSRRDAADLDHVYRGGPVTAVRTTGIFCRPGCPAKPRPENVERFRTPAEAMLAGYRACRRCHPLGRGRARGSSRDAFNAALQALAAARPEQESWRAEAPTVHVRRLDTPLGPMIGAATSTHLVLLEFADRRMLATQFRRVRQAHGGNFVHGANPVLRALARELREYFGGRRRAFDVPLTAPGTAFQTRVWSALRRIPYGQTRSYAQLARGIGRPSATRAVAHTNGDNRLAIVIPCHRVVGADGSLTGYSGGVWRKRLLLALESGAGVAGQETTTRALE